MRYSIIIIFLLILNASIASGQNDTVFSRDTIELNYQIKNTILPAYQNLLITISSPDINQNEIDRIIENYVNGTKESKLFYNDKVIIENDLNPGAANDKSLRGDVDVIQYLKNFNTNYSKTEIPNISLSVSKISSLKKKEYFYYNVLFECDYGGTTSSGKKFSKFNRIVELVIVKEGKWRPYIGAIRFPGENNKDFDNTNDYKDIIESNGDLERILRSLQDEKQAKKLAEERKIKNFIFEGDNAFDEKKYDVALSKYHEAFIINPNDKEIIERVERARKAIAEKKAQELAEAEKQKHIALLKVNAKREKDHFNFKLAKLDCDSLIKDFGVTDPDIIKLNEKMATINSSLSSIDISVETKKYSDAIDKCDAEIKKAKPKKDSLFISEFNYQAARVSILSDNEKDSRIMSYLNDAISFSDNHHQEALKLRAKMFVKAEKVSDAIQDATSVIENDSRNPANYIFRANILENNKLPDRAIEDYAKAISYKTTDRNAFINKAKLENDKLKYSDVNNTCTEGIKIFKNAGELYYYRGLAIKSFGEYVLAGKDFREAMRYGINETEKNVIHFISFDLIAKGTTSFQRNLFQLAIGDFTKAIAIDSNENALYFRALNYIRLKKDDSALVDLNALIHIRPKYPNAFCERGIALTDMNEFPAAIVSFDNEIVHNPTNSLAFYYKGQCELKQKNYTNAAASFERSATIAPSDSAYYFAAVAYYNQKNYDLTIAKCQMAVRLDTKKFQVHYICGRAFYDKKNYNAAIKEYEIAKTLIARNDDLTFNYALALEMNESFDKASAAYNQLTGIEQYNDTSEFRSAVCIIKKHDTDKYGDAIKKFSNYAARTKGNHAEAHAYIAYACLGTNNAAAAAENIRIATTENANDPMLNYVLACQNAMDNKEAEAISFLDKALESKRFTKDDVTSEKYFKPIKKGDKFKLLLAKYF